MTKSERISKRNRGKQRDNLVLLLTLSRKESSKLLQ